MSNETDVFFIQTAWGDAVLDDATRWSTDFPFCFADRAYAEQAMADLFRDALPQPRIGNLDRDSRIRAAVEEMSAKQPFLVRLRRQLHATRRRLSGGRDSADERKSMRDPLFAVLMELAADAERVEVVHRVVSSAELRAEGEDALRAANEAADFGVLLPDERV